MSTEAKCVYCGEPVSAESGWESHCSNQCVWDTTESDFSVEATEIREELLASGWSPKPRDPEVVKRERETIAMAEKILGFKFL